MISEDGEYFAGDWHSLASDNIALPEDEWPDLQYGHDVGEHSSISTASCDFVLQQIKPAELEFFTPSLLESTETRSCLSRGALESDCSSSETPPSLSEGDDITDPIAHNNMNCRSQEVTEYRPSENSSVLGAFQKLHDHRNKTRTAYQHHQRTDRVEGVRPPRGIKDNAGAIHRPMHRTRERILRFDGLECSLDSGPPEVTAQEATVNRKYRFEMRRSRKLKHKRASVCNARSPFDILTYSNILKPSRQIDQGDLRAPPTRQAVASVDALSSFLQSHHCLLPESRTIQFASASGKEHSLWPPGVGELVELSSDLYGDAKNTSMVMPCPESFQEEAQLTFNTKSKYGSYPYHGHVGNSRVDIDFSQVLREDFF